MSRKKDKAEDRSYDYQRELGMIDSVSDDHLVARRMGYYDGYKEGVKEFKDELNEWLSFKKCSTQDRYVRQAFEEVMEKIKSM